MPNQQINWDTVGLGTKPDYVLTKELGVQFNRVGRERRKRNIPIFQEPDAIDWNTAPLGTKPDTALARELHVTREAVKYHRQKRNIPAFIGLVLTQEGNPCRSVYEAMYDAYLHWQHIPHEHEVRISDLPYIADFKVGEQFIEIAGMLAFPKYAAKQARKKRELEQRDIPVKWLTLEDVEYLYLDCPIPLCFRSQRICIECGKQPKRLAAGYCMHCYMLKWRSQATHEAICKNTKCGKKFFHHENDSPKYCSHKCYAQSMEFNWPPLEWLTEQLQCITYTQLARQLKVSTAALYNRVNRTKKIV